MNNSTISSDDDQISMNSDDSLDSIDSIDSNTQQQSDKPTTEVSPRGSHHPHPLYESDKHTREVTKTQTAASSVNVMLGMDHHHVVPRKKRRGLLLNMSVIPEYDNARMYPTKVKFLIVFVVLCCAMTGPMGTSILMPLIDSVTYDLHTSVTVVNVSVGIYLFTLGFFPLYWSSYSEAFGRRSIYIVSYLLFVCFNIGCALSTTIGMLIGFRVLCGATLASVQSVGAGTIGDLFPPQERGRAMGIYYLGPLGGPLFLPIIGGLLADTLGWRSTQWFLVILGGGCCILIIILLPETLRKEDNREAIRRILALRLKPRHNDTSSEDIEAQPLEDERSIQRILTNQSVRSIQRSLYIDAEEDANICDSHLPSVSRVQTNRNSEMFDRLREHNIEKLRSKIEELHDEPEQSKWDYYRNQLYIFLLKPLKSVVFLRYPSVFLAVLYSGPIFSMTYFVNLTLTYAYSREPYNFSEVVVGLVYIPNSVTYIIASIFGGRWTDKLLKEYAAKHNGELAPEARFGPNVWLAASLFPISLLIIGWCLDKKTHWVAPLVGTSIFGFASMTVVGTTVTYLVDSLPGRGATGVLLNNLIRMTLATVLCFITEPLIRLLGIGVLFSILSGISAVMGIVLIFLKKKGTYWRETYDLAKLYDLLE